MTNTSSVFFWATGQDDNIGDSLLRRAGLELLYPDAAKCVWIKNASRDFATGLGEIEAGSLMSSFPRWTFKALGESLRRPTVIVLNAGEVPVSWRGAAKIAVLTAVGLIARPRGGGLLWVGAGVPPTKRKLALTFYRAAARVAFHVRWRDPVSAEVIGRGSVGPDWAFALGTDVSEWSSPNTRGTLAVVLRGDRRPPTDEWWTWVDDTAERLGLDIAMVVQVRRDGPLASEIATARGYRVVEWSADATHAEQEELVRRTYRDSRVVLGDRLHGLIVGATEGALPLGWVESSKGKIARHFDAVNLGVVGEHEGAIVAKYPQIDADMVDSMAADLSDAVERARDYLMDETSELVGRRRAARSIEVGG
ncbi:MAG: hypothetical protein K0S37_2024 [Microbacterium sp.]|jgi:polysaccharide pyruvyl transferase WcaK-like protein|nr:hypothetical protein [Microbacterium sp.]